MCKLRYFVHACDGKSIVAAEDEGFESLTSRCKDAIGDIGLWLCNKIVGAEVFVGPPCLMLVQHKCFHVIHIPS